MSNQMDQAIQSVIDLHVLIENVFTGQNAEQSLTPLLNSFDQNFKMVTVQGQSIGLAEVKNLFSQNIGKKPSLKITILKSTALYEFENYCWVQYQEHQQTDETETVRTSTACIKVEDEKCYWVYLHETLVPSSS
ncbi:TPA: hypothetical protein ACSE38_002613 [Acinetobacter baumannii]|uniref:DUF4440 domain-containing protein n=10 Tax=Acinetobacter baumannii TaxID=470 RepID=A0A219CCP6_ACIBA|nr:MULTISPECIES: hypothetical protein [Acinetobacter]ADX91895.1 hypothetical protein ABTW07_1466 [Acinetobacter baumannii TCDC-AB0715]AHX28152.1 hypothetical protein A478_06085 [Acinetobacter baumannii AC12]AHX64180.1 hypothetical protein B856_02620 [Acinetobacter baumannii AC30]EMT89747.1 hypothetical protein ABNIH5_09851 [Acinetobacter baumannii ABNIH5]ETY69974.1 hypothetical protein X964_02160 [Acinetobacter baumannii MDR_MMC4]EXB08349.1 hypothetical protein J513_3593 [Acinetobacter bauman